MRAWKGELGSSLKGVLPKWHGSFQVRLTPSVIPSEVEESLILTITSSKRCLDCARHDKKLIWATRPKFFDTCARGGTSRLSVIGVPSLPLVHCGPMTLRSSLSISRQSQKYPSFESVS